MVAPDGPCKEERVGTGVSYHCPRLPCSAPPTRRRDDDQIRGPERRRRATGGTRPRGRRAAPAAARAQRVPSLPCDHDPLDGQRRLRAREQRRLLLVLRHRGEPLPDRARRARHPSRRGDRPGRRDRLPLLRAAGVSRDAGLRVTRLGTSSVRYEVALFGGDAPLAAAQGHFVHVYVDRETRRPAALPSPLRAALQDLAG